MPHSNNGDRPWGNVGVPVKAARWIWTSDRYNDREIWCRSTTATCIKASDTAAWKDSQWRDALDLCYQVSWFLNQPQPTRKVIRPVTAFPKEHALVKNNYCGGQKAVGAPIPYLQKWSPNGATLETDTTCRLVSGGSLFYAYNQPQVFSSNTGFEQSVSQGERERERGERVCESVSECECT